MENYNVDQKIQEFMARIEAKNPNEPEFLQAVKEVAVTVIPFISTRKQYTGKKLLERMAEPERTIIFRVPWVDDKGEIQVNRGFRIQMNSAIGPYKGGIRFHPTVNLSVLKFLAFEQTFKNSLTTLPMGGGKGGADFDPQGKSDMEIMRFCQAFMTEMCKHIGPETDVPAGDIGVGAREIGYLFGQYKKIRNEFTGVLTGKGLAYGGSLIRPEATGYGVVYFAEQMLKTIGQDFKGKTVCVSGFGNVAWGVVKKVTELGGKVLTISGPDGYIYDKDGLSGEKIEYLLELRASGNNRAEDYAKKFPTAEFHAGKRPWEVKCDVAALVAILSHGKLRRTNLLDAQRVGSVAHTRRADERAVDVHHHAFALQVVALVFHFCLTEEPCRLRVGVIDHRVLRLVVDGSLNAVGLGAIE